MKRKILLIISLLLLISIGILFFEQNNNSVKPYESNLTIINLSDKSLNNFNVVFKSTNENIFIDSIKSKEFTQINVPLLYSNDTNKDFLELTYKDNNNVQHIEKFNNLIVYDNAILIGIVVKHVDVEGIWTVKTLQSEQDIQLAIDNCFK
ncbi:hypothetical protein EDC19_2309 [Natranaerovirga hydrolytica]|uniref:Uncharacterized protein n=1 Tax=Natranaerovirga hydrolytica TaxID=680378 RepID=A0A4R1MFN8_9FIRM|nr:hypothetical protein [Natranaerovirga hydrolytica]TCK90540.1 hypothetical protein EDC19_2309 [Natranaerovirga hydrolytica]